MKEDAVILEEIYAKMDGLSFGFDERVLKILDNLESSKEERESIIEMISPEITARIFGLANSFCSRRAATMDMITTMNAAIMRLGTNYIKIFILGFSQLALAKDEKSKMILAESFATSFVGKFLAEQFGWNKELVQEVEIACLFLGIGRIIFHLHEKTSGENLPGEFIEKYHWQVNLKFIEKYSLPQFIADMVVRIFDQSRLDFKVRSISKTGAVMMAYATVKHIFAKKGRLVIASPVKSLDDSSGGFSDLPGETALKYFRSIGLSDRYLEVIMK